MVELLMTDTALLIRHSELTQAASIAYRCIDSWLDMQKGMMAFPDIRSEDYAEECILQFREENEDFDSNWNAQILKAAEIILTELISIARKETQGVG